MGLGSKHGCAMVLTLCLGALGAPGGVAAVSLEEVQHEVPAEVRALPPIGRLGSGEGTRLVVRGRLAKKRGAHIMARIRALRADLQRRFGAGMDRSKRPIQICLFPTTRAYVAFVDALFDPDSFQDDVGFFSPYHRLVAADLSRRAGVLDHELTHALLIDLPGRLPYWADEGLASLYTGFRLEAKGLRFDPRHRLSELRAARAAGRLPDLDRLAASGDRQVYGPGWRGYYSLGRFVLLYLARQHKLDTFIGQLRKSRLDPQRGREILRRFVAPGELWRFVDALPASP